MMHFQDKTDEKMKKLLYLALLLLPLGFMAASCSDDNDLPDVDVTVVYDNVVMENNVLYVVQGDIMKVTGIDCKGNDGKQALVNNVTYYLNGLPQIHPIFAPYGVGIDTGMLEPGRYVLTMGMNILQVDKSISTGMIDQSFIVVKTAEELPDGATPGEVTRTIRFTPK